MFKAAKSTFLIVNLVAVIEWKDFYKAVNKFPHVDQLTRHKYHLQLINSGEKINMYSESSEWLTKPLSATAFIWNFAHSIFPGLFFIELSFFF